MKTNFKYLQITKDDEHNLNRGGNCSVVEILDELKIAFKDDKEIQERILTSLKPDNLLKKNPDRKKLELRYSILKVTNKIAKMGKDPRWVYS